MLTISSHLLLSASCIFSLEWVRIPYTSQILARENNTGLCPAPLSDAGVALMAAAPHAQVKSDDASVAAADVQAHVASILGGGAGAALGDKRRRAAAARV